MVIDLNNVIICGSVVTVYITQIQMFLYLNFFFWHKQGLWVLNIHLRASLIA